MNKKEILVCGMLAITLILLMVNIFLTTNILKNKERIVTSVNMTNNLVEITKNVKPAVVRIVAETNQSPDSYFSSEIIKVDTGGLASIGTGFIVDPEGYIITANHVITGSNNIQVILFDEDKTEVKKAKIVKQNTQKDIAVIKIEGKDFPYLNLKEYDNTNEGEDIFFIGFPLGINFPTITKGIISSKIKKDKVFTINAIINPGNSGGPLISLEDGNVIGIINSKIRVVPNNLFIPKSNLPAMGSVEIMGIDFGSLVGVTVDTRNILLEVIEKNSQAGIGFSVSTDYVRDYK